MSTYTVVYPISRTPFTGFPLYCPKCHKQLSVYNLWKVKPKKSDRHEGAVAECTSGCKIELDGRIQNLFFYSYDVWELKQIVNDYEKKDILKRTDEYCKTKAAEIIIKSSK